MTSRERRHSGREQGQRRDEQKDDPVLLHVENHFLIVAGRKLSASHP
ncbi:MAG: hypothetical protein U1F36_19620 [Planctomycetota bacterium]